MKIQLIRNACMIIHHNNQKILVDPCLAGKGTLMPYTFFRSKPRRNPVVDLPVNAAQALEQVTAGLITHCRYGHFDHLDKKGAAFLAEIKVPVYCNQRDEAFLKKRSIHAIPIQRNRKSEFLDGTITLFPTKHGYGITGMLMMQGAGYYIELPGEKSLYISGDTVMTRTVRKVLNDFRPDIAVLNSGTATLDFGKPILMPIGEQLDFIKTAPGKVIAVHMDAFDHCTTSRERLMDLILKEGLSDKVIIPCDGEIFEV